VTIPDKEIRRTTINVHDETLDMENKLSLPEHHGGWEDVRDGDGGGGPGELEG
jgi:hypothetical protein